MSDYILPELIPNILARLPIDALLRCTSVCKSWYSLITSPSFTSSHLKLSTPNQESRLLIRYMTHSENEDNFHVKENYCLHRDNQTFDEIAVLDPPFTIGNWFIVGCFNGLFCLSDSRMERIMLWNPSLKKSLKLPMSNPRNIFNIKGPNQHCIGYGFLPTINDYKIVKLSYLKLRTNCSKISPEVEIYELSTGSWRNVNAGEISYVFENYSDQAFLNGIVHWDAYNSEPGDVFTRLIGSFDMTTEKFGAFMLPSCMKNDLHLSVSAFGESLCLMHKYSPYNYCTVWVMKEYGVADSWEKLFHIDIEHNGLLRPIYFRGNGEILFAKMYETVIPKPELVSYDCKNKQVKNVVLLADLPLFQIYAYVESLVLIKGSNEIKSHQVKGNKHVAMKFSKIK